MTQPAKTDSQILKIVAHLLTKEGERFTMARLVEESGLSRATLYRRFGSRRALLERVAAQQKIEIAELEGPDIPTRILEAARTVFARAGLVGATMEEIAQEANVGVATLYRHFGSKEQLIRAFSNKYGPRSTIQTLALQEDGDLESDLLRIATQALHFSHDNRDILRLSLTEGEEARKLLGHISHPTERTLPQLTQYFQKQIAAGHLQPHDPTEMALAFSGLIFSFSIFGPAFYETPFKEPERVARFVVSMFLEGVKT